MGLPQSWKSALVDYMTGRANRWTTASRATYLALLTADPGVNPATPGALTEVSTPGYARQQVTWTTPVAGVSPNSSNTAAINFGPFSSAMGVPATFVALVTTASGATGDVIYTWSIPAPLAAASSESIQIPANSLILLNGSDPTA